MGALPYIYIYIYIYTYTYIHIYTHTRIRTYCRLTIGTCTLIDCLEVTGGRNGYGAKLTNIFSTKFVPLASWFRGLGRVLDLGCRV